MICDMGVATYQPLCLSLPWNLRSPRRDSPPRLLLPSPKCALTKQGHRFLSSVSASASADATNRLIRKFVASSPKSVALNALSHLLSPDTTHPHLSSIAILLYSRITEASWFSHNPKLAADVVALLYTLERLEEAETLAFESVSKLGLKERDVGLFYCNLMDSLSKHGSGLGFFNSLAGLKRLVSGSSSVYVKRRAFGSMISGLCAAGLPQEAEGLMREMRASGFKLSVFEFRSLVHGYGKLGFFQDMNTSIHWMRNEGFVVDTICSNMVLSSYGAHGNRSEMLMWLRDVKKGSGSCSSFSIRTYNSVLNSCPMMVSLLQNLNRFPLSMDELMENLDSDESLLVKELICSSVLADAMHWSSSLLKLDLHEMHVTSAYLILLQWMEELRRRFGDENCVIPLEVVVVCGSGKHSVFRGKSPVKGLLREMMAQTKSPLRIDRKNIGCYIAKGQAVKDWLC